MTTLSSTNLTNIKFVDASSGWDAVKSAAEEAASKGMLLYINGDLTIQNDYTLTCTTILNGDLSINDGSWYHYNEFHVANFLYVIGSVNAEDNTRLCVEGGLAVEGNLNIDHTVYVEYTGSSFSLPKVSITYETEGVELATQTREMSFADLLENDWDSDALHHADLDEDSLAITEFRITDSDGTLHIITADGIHTIMADGEAVPVEAGADGTHTVVVNVSHKVDANGEPVTDENGSPIFYRDSVTFDCDSETITMTSEGSNTKNVGFQYQVKDAHGLTDLADVSMQVTAVSEAGSEGSDIIQGSTTTLVDGAHYNIAVSIDRSSSMKDEIKTAKEAVQNFIDSLWQEAKSHDSVVNLHLNAFDDDVEYSTSWLITASTTEAEITAMKNYVSFSCGRGTNYAAAFRDMTDWFEKMEVEQADEGVTYTNKVVFITDGAPSTETSNTDRDFGLLKQECGDVHTIGINVGNGLSLNKLQPYDTTVKGAELISSAEELGAALEHVTSNLPNADATFANKGDDLIFGDQASFSYEGQNYSLAAIVKLLSGSETALSAAETIVFAKENAALLNRYLIDASNDQPDVLVGGDGVDVLYGMGADDLIIGGGSNSSGTNDIRFQLADALDVTLENDASAIAITDKLTDAVKETVTDALASADPENALSVFSALIEELESGTDSGDLLFGNSGNDVIFGMEGNDRLDGGAGSDILFGQGGSDLFVYDKDDYFVSGGSGIDFLLGSEDTPSLAELLSGIGEGQPMVNSVEVLVKGSDTASLTSLTELRTELGITVNENGLTLGTGWQKASSATAQSDGTAVIVDTYTCTVGEETITLETTLAANQISLQNG